MSQRPPSSAALRVADLSTRKATPFALHPDPDARRQIAEELDLLGIRKLTFEGTVQATGGADWQLLGRLGATVVQPCAVTLAPVTSRIDETVARLYQNDYQAGDDPETEMPEDDTTEELTHWIDPEAVMREALILSLPLYPRAADAAFSDVAVTEPGVAPMRDEDARPFAGLAELRQKMASKTSPEED